MAHMSKPKPKLEHFFSSGSFQKHRAGPQDRPQCITLGFRVWGLRDPLRKTSTSQKASRPRQAFHRDVMSRLYQLESLGDARSLEYGSYQAVKPYEDSNITLGPPP